VQEGRKTPPSTPKVHLRGQKEGEVTQEVAREVQ